ncbi:MAG: MMPL family transporter [Methanomassiliicoccales archaeon]|jgi:RND superfamily putative drug exporter
MIFDRIASGLTKHYKKVLIVWVIALLISVPAMLQVNSVVQYQESQMASGSYESLQAQDVVSQQFQSSVANGTILVVLQSNNVTDAASRDFVLALQERILASHDIRFLENVTSAYSATGMMMDQVVIQLGPAMRPAEVQVNMSAFLLYGIPAVHMLNWTQVHAASPTLNVTETDAQAFNLSKAYLDTYLQSMDPQNKAMAYQYYFAITDFWNGTSSNTSLVADPFSRANYCIINVGPGFIAALPAPVTSAQKQVMSAVLKSFDLISFSNQTKVRDFTLGMIGQMAGITNTTFLQAVYDLGPNYQIAAVHSFDDRIIRNGTLATYPVKLPAQLLSNLVAPNNKTMLFMATFSVTSAYTESTGVKPLVQDVGFIRDIVSHIKSETGSTITVYVTGDAAISSDMETSSTHDMQIIEPLTIVIIIVLMGVLFRSVVAEWIPLGAVGVALGVSQALVFVIGSLVANIQYTVLTMLFVVLMGVGTDYSIFLMTRYREERIKGATREQAVHTSVTWAGESIVTSGATVVIAFFAMGLSSFSMVQTMGLVLGMAIVVALLVALTLIPSLLMLLGNRIFWPTTGDRWKKFAEKTMQKRKDGHRGYFHRAASFSVHHAKVILVAAILVSIPATYLYLTTETSFDFIGSMGTSESTTGMNAMSADFGAGRIMPTQVVFAGSTVVYDGTNFNLAYLDAIENVSKTVAGNSLVQQVTGPTRPYGTPIDYRNLSALSAETKQQMIQSMLQSVGRDNKSVLLTVVLKEQPMAALSVNLMPTLRSEIAQEKTTEPVLAGTSIMVGGSTAIIYDLSVQMNEQFGSIELLVVIGIFIVLMVVLGSLLLPTFAVISIAMSISWSFAATSLVFGTWLDKPILWMVPLILFIMLMGIGMDYNVFILTRIREEVHKGKDTNEAVVDAVDWTGGIITALALIMGGAFGSMMLSGNTMLQEFGFALAFAILVDAMVVRTYIVPAAMSLMGKRAWWAPGRLQREGRMEKVEKKE